MLNKYEFAARIGLDFANEEDDYQFSFMYAKKILPEAIRVGGEHRWREEDVELFVDYLKARGECEERGIDPNGPDGPAQPVYSTAGPPRYDIRLVIANNEERERQKKSKTLAAGAKSIGPQQHIELPEVKTNKSKAK